MSMIVNTGNSTSLLHVLYTQTILMNKSIELCKLSYSFIHCTKTYDHLIETIYITLSLKYKI